MAMGERKPVQESLFFVAADLPRTPAHPFYQKLNTILAEHGFDPFVQNICAGFYHETMGRPSLPPGRSTTWDASNQAGDVVMARSTSG